MTRINFQLYRAEQLQEIVEARSRAPKRGSPPTHKRYLALMPSGSPPRKLAASAAMHGVFSISAGSFHFLS